MSKSSRVRYTLFYLQIFMAIYYCTSSALSEDKVSKQPYTFRMKYKNDPRYPIKHPNSGIDPTCLFLLYDNTRFVFSHNIAKPTDPAIKVKEFPINAEPFDILTPGAYYHRVPFPGDTPSKTLMALSNNGKMYFTKTTIAGVDYPTITRDPKEALLTELRPIDRPQRKSIDGLKIGEYVLCNKLEPWVGKQTYHADNGKIIENYFLIYDLVLLKGDLTPEQEKLYEVTALKSYQHAPDPQKFEGKDDPNGK